ncbi:Gfo/Idh/MocA family protein [Flavihumibacter solisilvae]|uniref:Oxidoreductase n=1 Tax=Flavihumibacter solisilvae TaxID=1349421 RepID=A0A0C1ITE5_9BACT|nr:Gfo/Idh/MocA family oxidoreductase [Flavihumibacter solisilvae]KIC93714.1 oxidoreductase [Flavihumibacter solisilvae]
MNISILGTGFIARFYAETLVAQRRKDVVNMVYGRSPDKTKKFAEDYNVPNYTSNLKESISHPDVDAVIIALPNNMHLEAVLACAEAKKPVLCTKPLGRNGKEALAMLQAAEKAGIFAGYLEDLCYTPKFLKSLSSINNGAIGRVIWTKSRESHPGPHSDWFWDKEKAGGGAIIDLGCHCVEISRNFIGKDIRPVEVMCWADTCMHPIDAEDNAVGLVRYENGAIGQFEVSWSFRGGMDLRDEVMGTEGTIWTNNFLRTGFEMFSTGSGDAYVAEKSESNSGWLFPVGDEVHELGYNHMFTDMFDAIENSKQPLETFYDGYIVNAIIDAAYQSARTKKWEPVIIEDWRGTTEVNQHHAGTSYDENYYLIKEEILPSGEKKIILKNKKTGAIEKR